jgi:hypothetical protein
METQEPAMAAKQAKGQNAASDGNAATATSSEAAENSSTPAAADKKVNLHAQGCCGLRKQIPLR